MSVDTCWPKQARPFAFVRGDFFVLCRPSIQATPLVCLPTAVAYPFPPLPFLPAYRRAVQLLSTVDANNCCWYPDTAYARRRGGGEMGVVSCCSQWYPTKA